MLDWLNGSATKPPVFLEFRSSKGFIVTSVAAAVFTDVFLYGIIVPVLPFALSSRVGVRQDSVQTWVSILLAIYGAALLVAAPIAGWFADVSASRRLSLLVGLVTLAGSTVLLNIGSSIGVFVVGRILQGASAAVVWVVGLALLSDTVGAKQLGYYMGFVGLAMSMSILAAPLLGGIVFDRAGYYAVFAMAYGLLGLDIVLRLALVEKKVALRWLKESEIELPDEGEVVTTGTSELDPETQEPYPQEPTTADVSATANRKSAGEATEPKPTPPGKRKRKLPPLITLLASYRLDAALFGCLIQAALLTSFDSILPLYVREIFSWDSTGAGLIFLPLTIPSFIGPLVGLAADKHGARYLATAGFLMNVPLLILLRLVTHDSLPQKVLLCALLALVAVALTLVLTPLMAEITYAVEAKAAKSPPGHFGKGGAYAQAYGLFNMAFAAGSMAGPLLAGLIKQSAGWGTATLALGVVSGVSALPTLVWSGGSIFKARRRRRRMRRRKGGVVADCDVGGGGGGGDGTDRGVLSP